MITSIDLWGHQGHIKVWTMDTSEISAIFFSVEDSLRSHLIPWSEMIYSVDNYNNMLQNFSRWILDKRFLRSLSSDSQNHWSHQTLFRLHFEAIIYLCVCFHIAAKRLNANFQCLKHIMRIAPVWLCKNASKLRKCWLKIQKKTINIKILLSPKYLQFSFRFPLLP